MNTLHFVQELQPTDSIAASPLTVRGRAYYNRSESEGMAVLEVGSREFDHAILTSETPVVVEFVT